MIYRTQPFFMPHIVENTRACLTVMTLKACMIIGPAGYRFRPASSVRPKSNIDSTALLVIRPTDNAAALGMLLVMSPPVENLARLLGGEVLLTLHCLGLGTLAVTSGALLGRALACVPVAFVPTAFVPTAFAHGFRHYSVEGENHDAGGRTYR